METIIYVFMGCFILVIIAILSVICIISTRKDKAKKQADDKKINDENNYFIESGCIISKRIKNLLIDDNNKKWMVAGTEKIFNYSDVKSVKIVENGNQIEYDVLSAHTTIKNMYVSVSTTDTLNALVDIPIFETRGNSGLQTSSYEYTQFKKIALEQEAFFNAVIAKNNTTKI
ncbi:MAG: hypothetical protein ACI4JJ_08290 [Huintestinicola sp.]